jgi:hypothetical protein
MLPNETLGLKWCVEETAKVKLLRNPKKTGGGVEEKVHSEGVQPPMEERELGRHVEVDVKSEGGKESCRDGDGGGGGQRWEVGEGEGFSLV